MGDRIFVCYSRKDKGFVHKLAANLKARGVPIWLDEWDIPTGADWDRTIDDALNDCAYFLIVLSPASADSIEVRGELRVALDKSKPILPVLYRSCSIPRQLLTIEYVDFSSRRPDDEGALTEITHTLGMPDTVALPSDDGADRKKRMAWPPLRTWPVWAWAVAGLVVVLLLGGSYLGIRSVLQPRPTPTENPTRTPTVAFTPMIVLSTATPISPPTATPTSPPMPMPVSIIFGVDRTEIGPTNA